MKVLVLNCGSSSIKYKLFDMTSGEVMAQGGIEKTVRKLFWKKKCPATRKVSNLS